ncbi:MAG TPA: flagellar biosynthesis anti-sigma factor FlgM [Anaerolineae bacterium]|nr:flagellar biosynthesis anti-sigma factor FlgM [Anaerolineae bacterium]HIQ06344.1 flagellar biosynthesis anti-sigma factor FlgM [Anaerolineae bacterium]
MTVDMITNGLGRTVARAFNQETQPVENQKVGSNHVPASPKGDDEIVLSDRAQTLQRASEAVHAAPDVRQERVMQLRAQIAEGKYKIPMEELLDRLLGRGRLGR